MLPTEACILIYGRDAQLLDTRRMVLERSGARIWTATNLTDFDRIAGGILIDLIVLCHSLSTEECDHAQALARARWPLIQRLVLVTGQRGCYPDFSEQVVDAGLGPAYLLQTVTKLMSAEQSVNFHVR